MTIIIDPQSSGIAGNMIIGALVDLGADADELKSIMEKSAKDFGKVEVSFEKKLKHGISSTFCHVEMLEHKHSVIRVIKSIPLIFFCIDLFLKLCNKPFYN